MKSFKSLLAPVLFSSTLLISGLAFAPSALADKGETSYLWNEETKEVSTVSSDVVNVPVVDETATSPKHNIDVPLNPPKDELSPNFWIRTLHRYDQTRATVDYKKKYVGSVRLDNTNNAYTEGSITFEASVSDSWSVTVSGSASGSAEKNLVVAKVNATVTIGGSYTRSWSKGTKYGSALKVPPRKVGSITAYIPGVSSNGQMVYKMTNDSTGDVRYENVALGAVVPSRNDWNFVTSVN